MNRKGLFEGFYDDSDPPILAFLGGGGKNKQGTPRKEKAVIKKARTKLDAAFLLTVGRFLLTVELSYLQLTILAFLLTVEAFLLTVGKCV